MKRFISYILAGVVGVSTASGLLSCSAEIPFDNDGEGTVHLQTSINSIITRVNEGTGYGTDNQRKNCVVSIYRIDGDKQGLNYQVKGLDNLKESIKLAAGKYRAEAWTGVYRHATFDYENATEEFRYYEDIQEFKIANGDIKTISLNCKIKNVAVSIDTKTLNTILGSDNNSYNSADLSDYMKDDYEITIGHSKKTLTFTKDNATATAYFMMPEGETTLNYTIKGHRKDAAETDDKFVKTGTIENVQSAYHYTIKFRYQSQPNNDKGGVSSISIDIDKNIIPTEDEIYVNSEPSITGLGFDITETKVYANDDAIPSELPVMICTNGNGISNVAIMIDERQEFKYSLPNDKDAANEKGMVWTDPEYNTETNITSAFILFKKAFIKGLSAGSEHTIKITVTDTYGKITEQVMKIQRM